MTLSRSAALQDLVAEALVALDGADAEAIVHWASERLAGRIAVATSMQDAVVVDIASRVQPGIDVIFLDTGYHFAETIGMRDAVATTYPIRLLSVQPALTVADQDAEYGPELFARDPDRCCQMRKVLPLDTMLGRYDGWVTGLRRSEAASRASVLPVEWDAKREMVKVNPICAWSDDDVEAYIAERGVLVNPLRSEGYLSIGCAPCTSAVSEGADARSGRWHGLSKNECGLHV